MWGRGSAGMLGAAKAGPGVATHCHPTRSSRQAARGRMSQQNIQATVGVGLPPPGLELLHAWRLDDRAYQLAWSPDGCKIAAAAGPNVHVWDTASGSRESLWRPNSTVVALAWSHDGRMLAIGTR